jgi:hypothetical protein
MARDSKRSSKGIRWDEGKMRYRISCRDAELSVSYVRRAPERGVLHRIVREHLQTFLWELDRREHERSAPLFVKREFQRPIGLKMRAELGRNPTSWSSGVTISATRKMNLASFFYFSDGKMRFQSRFISTTIQPLSAAISSTLSSVPTLLLRS